LFRAGNFSIWYFRSGELKQIKEFMYVKLLHK
jgi:hypothetical protein